MDPIFYLIPLFLLISIIYSSIGFGGGSSYLAIMALFELSYLFMPKIALLCNLTVVTGGTIIFHRQGLLPINKVLPVISLSVPLAFLGGLTRVEELTFHLILTLALLISGIQMLLSKANTDDPHHSSTSQVNWKTGVIIGGIIAYISGLLGIGGGIFLAPVLYMINWGKAKEIAACASLFILVNSLAGLVGHLIKDHSIINQPGYLLLIPVVFLGGQIGSRIGTKILSEKVIKKLTAILILFVSLRMLYLISIRS